MEDRRGQLDRGRYLQVMQTKGNSILIAVGFVGLMAASSLASAAPTSAPMPEPTLELNSPAVSESSGEATSDSTEPVEATNFVCLAQCARAFTECLASECTDEECQAQYNECRSFC